MNFEKYLNEKVDKDQSVTGIAKELGTSKAYIVQTLGRAVTKLWKLWKKTNPGLNDYEITRSLFKELQLKAEDYEAFAKYLPSDIKTKIGIAVQKFGAQTEEDVDDRFETRSALSSRKK
jgi:predicted DNA-binding protein YlxM (UPF0122 family)